MFSNFFSKEEKVNDIFYVYALVDWREEDNWIFYVGKGKNDRAFDHIDDAERTSRWNRSDKHKRIINILRNASNENIDEMVINLGENLTEGEAFILESIIIESIGLYNLTNKISGICEDKWQRYANEIDAKKINKCLKHCSVVSGGVNFSHIKVDTNYLSMFKSLKGKILKGK